MGDVRRLRGLGVADACRRARPISGGLTNALDAANVSYPNPLRFLPRHGWYSDLLLLSFVLGIVTGMLVIASVFVRRRGASPSCVSSWPGWATSAC